MQSPHTFIQTIGRCVGLAALALGLAQGAAAAPASAEPAGYTVFSGKRLDFERTSNKVVGVYVPSWESSKLIDAVPAGSVTHVLYAFLHVCGPGQLPRNEARCAGKAPFELGTGEVEQEFDQAFLRFKARAPHVKILASVGGWGGSDPFFHMANDAKNRAVFAASVKKFLRTHTSFDGIDIDWEHPTTNGSANGVPLGKPEDGQGFADLMADLRKAVDALSGENGHFYLVSAAVNTGADLVKKINYREAQKHMDYVFLMTYDFYGGWSPTVGNHTTPYSSKPDGDDSLAAAVKNFTAAGVPASKLVAGVAMYGRGYTGVKPLPAGATTGFTGASKAGSFPGADGSITYREIVAGQLGPQGKGIRGYQALADSQTGAWNLYNAKSKLFVGYDDPRAVLKKGELAVKQGLAGVFAWELSQDNGDIINAMNVSVGQTPVVP